MRAIGHLEGEHRLIDATLDRTLAALDRFDADFLHAAMEMFVNFVDRVHHTEEEEVIFDTLRALDDDFVLGPLAVLEREHGVSRAHLKSAMEALPAAVRGVEEARGQVDIALRAYVQVVRAHIQREDELLFPMARRLLAPVDDDELLARMLAVEARSIHDGDLERWRVLAGLGAGTRVERAPLPETPAAALDARALAAGPRPPSDAAPAGAAGVLFDDGSHRVLLLHDFGRGMAVQANQFLIVDGGEGMILDPGGPKIYSRLFAEMQRHLRADALKYIFLSHQDPDIGTSINAWLMDTDADAYISRLWMRFLPHFGIDKLLEGRLRPIPDPGMSLALGDTQLALVPAHFLHSPGNFQVYDPRSRILFSGDLGASIETDDTVVTDFDAHVPRMLGFHRRYMASRRAMRAWVAHARELDIETIAPQHGAIFRGRELVERFLDWCSDLECGVDLLAPR